MNKHTKNPPVSVWSCRFNKKKSLPKAMDEAEERMKNYWPKVLTTTLEGRLQHSLNSDLEALRQLSRDNQLTDAGYKELKSLEDKEIRTLLNSFLVMIEERKSYKGMDDGDYLNYYDGILSNIQSDIKDFLSSKSV